MRAKVEVDLTHEIGNIWDCCTRLANNECGLLVSVVVFAHARLIFVEDGFGELSLCRFKELKFLLKLCSLLTNVAGDENRNVACIMVTALKWDASVGGKPDEGQSER